MISARTRLISFLAFVSASLVTEGRSVSTSPLEVTTHDILQALVDADWKWQVRVSDGSKSLSLELVEVFQDGDVFKERSLVGEKGWFQLPLSGESIIEVCVLKMRASHHVWLRAGQLSGMYKLPENFEWPSASEYYPNKWHDGYLLLLRDIRAATPRYLALKLVER